MTQSVVSRDSEIMGGTPVFAGTRVPVATLLDYLDAGDSIEEFLKGFPSIARERVIALLEDAKESRPEAGEYQATDEELAAIDGAERSGIASDAEVRAAFRAFRRRKSANR